jgi:hypothetical protein
MCVLFAHQNPLASITIQWKNSILDPLQPRIAQSMFEKTQGSWQKCLKFKKWSLTLLPKNHSHLEIIAKSHLLSEFLSNMKMISYLKRWEENEQSARINQLHSPIMRISWRSKVNEFVQTDSRSMNWSLIAMISSIPFSSLDFQR